MVLGIGMWFLNDQERLSVAVITPAYTNINWKSDYFEMVFSISKLDYIEICVQITNLKDGENYSIGWSY